MSDEHDDITLAEKYSELPPGEEVLCTIAPGWAAQFVKEDGVLIIAHPMSVPLAIPLNTIKPGDTLPRFDDFVNYKIEVS